MRLWVLDAFPVPFWAEGRHFIDYMRDSYIVLSSRIFKDFMYLFI